VVGPWGCPITSASGSHIVVLPKGGASAAQRIEGAARLGLGLVDRGKGMAAIQAERELASGGQLRQGSNMGMGQIKTADYIIDLGPEGGDEGGWVVATGTPEEIARQADKSYTGQFLKKVLSA